VGKELLLLADQIALRTPDYIGRHTLRELLDRYSQIIIKEPRCLAFYLQGEGGLGKTRLLEDYITLTHVGTANIRVCRIIDMVNPENRKPEILEQRLINGLKSDHTQTVLPPDEVAECFAEYYNTLDTFKSGLDHDQVYRDRIEAERRNAFAECWNMLSATYPLVIRLDTLERLFVQDIPLTALPRRRQVRAGVDIIRDWMINILPKLRHTLVLLSGRPPQPPQNADTVANYQHDPKLMSSLGHNELAYHLAIAKLLPKDGFQELKPLSDAADIHSYLSSYGVDPGERIAYIKQITGGSPLLLSLYAECQQPNTPTLFQLTAFRYPRVAPDTEAHAPANDEPLKYVTTSLEFEQLLTDTILNPLSYMQDPNDLTQNDDEREQIRQRLQDKLVLTYCLYILSYARRGLRPKDLRHILCQIEIEPALDLSDRLLERLKRQVLVKTISKASLGQALDDDLLFLHDEIWRLIDESGNPRDLGLKDIVLTELSKMSKPQVGGISQVGDPLGLLRAMADHIYYAITLNFGRGYRYYRVYLDPLFAQRNYEDALVLADVFWRMLTQTVIRLGGPVRLYQDLLAEDRRLSYSSIERYDQVDYVKLLRAQGNYRDAMDEADKLYRRFVASGVLIPLDTISATQPPHDLYLFADLALAWAQALTFDAPEGYETHVLLLCDKVIELFQTPEALEQALASTAYIQPRDETLLRLLRPYLLGQAYRIRGQLQHQCQDYDEAIKDTHFSVQAFEAYRKDKVVIDEAPEPVVPKTYLNHSGLDELAYSWNRLALMQLENGEFERAHRTSQMVQAHVGDRNPYQQALILNTQALIHLREGHGEVAQQVLEMAREAANLAQRPRALGIVAWTTGQIHRWMMNNVRHEPDPTISDFYVRAALLLQNERESYRDVLHDHARFLRGLACWYDHVGDAQAKADYLDQGLRKLAEAIHLLRPSQMMQRANLLETRISFLNIMGEYEEAHTTLAEAEAMMHMPMPRYGQVVCGTLALQRGYMMLSVPPAQNIIPALDQFAIALARAYVFGDTHHNRMTFARLIRRWVADSVPLLLLKAFVARLQRDPYYLQREGLPYQNESPVLTTRRWNESWEKSLLFFERLLKECKRWEKVRKSIQSVQATYESYKQAPSPSTLHDAVQQLHQLQQCLVHAREVPAEPATILPPSWEKLRNTALDLDKTIKGHQAAST